MLVFVKNGEVIHTEDLKNVDPLTLETYEELLSSTGSVVFCILVCENTKHVYLASSIVSMRYTVSGAIRIYKLKDPSTRNEVKDILYFEVVKNPLYLRIFKDIQKSNLLRGKEDAMDSLRDGACEPPHSGTMVRAVYIGSELDLVYNADLQKKVFRNGEKRGSFVSTLIGGAVFFLSFILLFFFMVCFFYILLRFVLLA
ncbi:hypothetical protein EHEL_011000 [Encephalitozoon hellem ATCC 50504]|uniref:Uncharacterized protein n=1 Tax=Encephalitozoon hellem TaxID=27973 RepID=A0A9Q9FAN9_ENCHE|nr:uncharacterized protein EHEL_011000 [Encephalitozoon hellem ATCC 50504]AFM97723.1 hypothetical protein EHEL_011000 [Encephalitozoon hellem ATCC 50504]UTX42415.1 hypothetical protein GPU96_01g01190 [Encephalitozoon hellem]WEL37858.1 hypothetical protein PFJ87_01g01120 [Encephalitozoon hellem]|eukprot:XP_003886704.1 hypothetical protein EHEL_011000 [Encephalitozoon hellem ATCC 50504]